MTDGRKEGRMGLSATETQELVLFDPLGSGKKLKNGLRKI